MGRAAADPEQMLGDKGYDSEAVRNDIEERGGEAAIPSTATRKIQHAVDKALYALRRGQLTMRFHLLYRGCHPAPSRQHTSKAPRPTAPARNRSYQPLPARAAV